MAENYKSEYYELLMLFKLDNQQDDIEYVHSMESENEYEADIKNILVQVDKRKVPTFMYKM